MTCIVIPFQMRTLNIKNIILNLNQYFFIICSLYIRYNLYESLVDIYILLQKVMSSMSKRIRGKYIIVQFALQK